MRLYRRRTGLVAEDFLGVLRGRVVVDFRFGGRAGSGGDVRASEAFSAVANAASPLMRSVQASSWPFRRPFCVRCNPSGDMVSVYSWPLMLNSRLSGA